jgi:imidazolonepropionase
MTATSEFAILKQPDRPAPPGKRHAVLIRGARQLLTLRGEARPRHGAEMGALGAISDGAVLIVNGIIREVGPTRRVERLVEARGAEEIDATGRTVLPGFIDCQTRPLAAPPSADWIEARCHQGPVGRPLLQKARTSPRLDLNLSRRLAQMARHGTVALAASPGWEPDARTMLKALRALNEMDGLPLRISPMVAVREGSDATLLHRASRDGLARMVSIDGRRPGAGQWAERARALGLPLRLHGDAETAARHKALMISGIPHWSADLAAALRDTNTVWAVCPLVDWLRGSSPAPLRQRIDDGLAVALASGFGLDSSPATNLAAAISVACLEHRLSPAEAITAVTINAAYAAGLASQFGSLTPGKRGDVLILDTGDFRELPLQLGTNLVHTVLHQGATLR